MVGVWRTLLWKEWREQRSVLAILAAFFVLVPAMFSLRTPTNYFGALSITFFALPLVSLFVAMNISAGEQASGTIGFLQSLPVSRRKWAAAKLFWAAVVVVVPIGAAVGVAALLERLIGIDAQIAIEHDARAFGIRGNWFVTRLVVSSVAAVSLLLWMAAPGVNRSDEVRAGAIGLLAAVGYWAFVAMIAELVEWLAGGGTSRIVSMLSAMGAGGIALMDPPPTFGVDSSVLRSRWSLYAVVMAAAHLTLAAWFVMRFGRVLPGNSHVAEAAFETPSKSWLAPPRRSPLRAIIWKQVRESLPLAALGALGIVAVALIVYFASSRRGPDDFDDPQVLLSMIGIIWNVVGLLVATVAGIGVFVEDLSPGINGFWRSRPIRIGQWFTVKYTTGFVITFAVVAVPLLAVGSYVLIRKDLPESTSERRLMDDARTFVTLAAVGQWALYSCALAAMVLLRRPIHAAFASLTVSIAMYVSAAVLAEAMDRGSPGSNIGVLLILRATIGFACSTAALAWFAVRNDWGWRR